MTIKVKLKLAVPGLSVGAEWQPDETERRAAWELYVELVTRISTVAIDGDNGLATEALASLYTLFGSTRDILRKYGPSVAPRRGRGGARRTSLGLIAVAMLNGGIRPVLSKWHPIVEDHEHNRPAGRSPLEHERLWPRIAELRDELNRLRNMLIDVATILGTVCGSADLLSLPAPGPVQGEEQRAEITVVVA